MCFCIATFVPAVAAVGGGGASAVVVVVDVVPAAVAVVVDVVVPAVDVVVIVGGVGGCRPRIKSGTRLFLSRDDQAINLD